MADRIVVIDFFGTLIKPSCAAAAEQRMYKQLGIKTPRATAYSDEYYEQLRAAVAKQYGLHTEHTLHYHEHFGEEKLLSGADAQLVLLGDIFRNCIFSVAAEQQEKIFQENIIEALQTIQARGFKVALASSARLDIITGVLAITRCPVQFDFVSGEDAVHSKNNKEVQSQALLEHGRISFVIADQMDDFKPLDGLDAKSVYFSEAPGTTVFSDYVISNASELEDIIT